MLNRGRLILEVHHKRAGLYRDLPGFSLRRAHPGKRRLQKAVENDGSEIRNLGPPRNRLLARECVHHVLKNFRRGLVISLTTEQLINMAPEVGRSPTLLTYLR